MINLKIESTRGQARPIPNIPRTIWLLWPTARPEVMMKTHADWIANASCPDLLRTLVAVDTEEQAELLPFETLVTNCKRDGAAYPAWRLGQEVKSAANDIIILTSDDMFPPHKDTLDGCWDGWLRKQFEEFDGAILVNDGHQDGGCMTIPIMTHNCLLRLNRIIYHPSYQHQFADAELYCNLGALGLLRDLRTKDCPIFEHRHWACGKRSSDAIDSAANHNAWADEATYKRRMALDISSRLR